MKADQILHTLLWEEENIPLITSLRADLIKRLFRYLDQLKWAIQKDTSIQGEEFLSLISKLNADELDKFIKGSLISEHLRNFSCSDHKKVINKLLPYLKAQLGSRDVLGQWTSNSEYYLAPQAHTHPPAQKDHINKGDSDYWYTLGTIENCYLNPKTKNGEIIVDFDSFATRKDEPESGILAGKFHPFSAKQKEKIFSKIDEALGILRIYCPAAFNLITVYTQTIRVRKRDGESFGSEQVPREIGSIRLSNTHLDEVNPLILAESIVHESVHNFLSCYEYLYETFSFSYEKNCQARPISPWSDNAIPHASFTHAICVYFAIYNFLQKIPQNDSNKLFIRQRLLACSSGFMQGIPITEYILKIGDTPSHIAGMFLKMQELVIRKENQAQKSIQGVNPRALFRNYYLKGA